ncbi:fha domain containing protein [Sporothrix schenckii 1099-18]|uniref:Fha domain containing protein n=1 Tax=Sporothrix schenckii 1099-18 TaxID=1397361 RepID=A0A0F2MJL8_SPOSC|nr:fha domain containing protein [Sporothrix schenckii 1099-18]KJR88381.1 fha domain containing protein [Sporothrix schenckii 1099-18]
MFTQSIPAPAPAPSPSSPGLHAVSTTTPASPTSRTSRLRGLSYLRNYTQSHLLNREHSSTGASSTGSGNTTAGTGNTASHLNQPSPSSPSSASGGLGHSETYPLRQTQSAAAAPTSSASSATVIASAVDPGLCLAPAVLHPLSITSTNSSQSVASDAAAPQPGSRAPADNQPGASTTASATAPTSAAVSSLQAAYRSDLQSASSPAPTTTNSPAAASLSSADAMAPSVAPQTTPTANVMTRSRSATEPGAANGVNIESLPSIRFSTFYDPRATRPSLKFAPMSRTLPTGKELIRVGRYSERDSQPNVSANVPSAAHVGFKSKVVSRRHCEFWYENNRWYIKDVKSSSGTFLNHIRLSQPGTESKPFPVNDGDIVQLGIDFKGGEEMIFRCVKMRVELNRGWQNKLNAFNVQTHKRLRNMTKPEGDGSKQSSQDCSICLNSIASLFVAPCSHTWHYKCIRALLESPQYPSFICPNCRAAVDLEADVEDPPEEWETMDIEEEESVVTGANNARSNDASAHHVKPRMPSDQRAGALSASAAAADIGDTTMQVDSVMEDIDETTSTGPAALAQQQQQQQRNERQELDSRLQRQLLVEQQQQEDEPEPVTESHVSHATSHPVPIPSGSRFPSTSSIANVPPTVSVNSNGINNERTPSPTERHIAPVGHEGPITPRNDAGPWVFDGSGIRIGSSRASTDSRRGEMRSLDTAAAEISGQFRT